MKKNITIICCIICLIFIAGCAATNTTDKAKVNSVNDEAIEVRGEDGEVKEYVIKTKQSTELYKGKKTEEHLEAEKKSNLGKDTYIPTDNVTGVAADELTGRSAYDGVVYTEAWRERGLTHRCLIFPLSFPANLVTNLLGYMAKGIMLPFHHTKEILWTGAYIIAAIPRGISDGINDSIGGRYPWETSAIIELESDEKARDYHQKIIERDNLRREQEAEMREIARTAREKLAKQEKALLDAKRAEAEKLKNLEQERIKQAVDGYMMDSMDENVDEFVDIEEGI